MTPPPSTSISKSFVDTTIVRKSQLGTSRIQEYLSKAIARKWYINNYIRMEYFRQTIIVWINLYFESADALHKTFGDACKFYSEGFGREPNNAVSLLATIEVEGLSFAKEEDKVFCRSRLQDFIYNMALQFEEMFTDMGGDPSHCARVRHALKVPDDATERDGQLLKVARIFQNEQECRSLCSISGLFTLATHAPKFAAIKAATAKGKTGKNLKSIQEAIDEATKDPDAITCRTCSKMGDAVIASALDRAWKLHSIDKVHAPIADALKLEYEIHPGEKALSKLTTSPAAAEPLVPPAHDR
jgi:hypothetical protein